MNDYLIPLIIALFIAAGGYGALVLGSVAENKRRFAPIIASIETRYGIPAGMLFRLIDAESAFRTDIIDGTVKSSAGAVGIAQIVPKYHPGINPLDPIKSIEYAGQYLAQLFKQFGTWEQAAAGYNWGPGNLQAAITSYGDHWFENAPKETQNYVKKVV